MIEQKSLGKILRRMGEPSWLILHTLTPDTPLPRYQILKRIEELYDEANYPSDIVVEPSTLTYALRRLVSDQLAAISDHTNVEIPASHGSTRWEIQPRYLRTELGNKAVNIHSKLYTAILKLGTN